MWKLYLKSDEGVAIQSTFKQLTDCFKNYKDNNVFIGKVKYIDYDSEYMPEGNVFYPFLHKRKSFEHEHEVRAIINKVPPDKNGKLNLKDEVFKDGLYVPINVGILIEKIYVSPTAPDWFYDLTKSVVNKYGLTKKVLQSNLNADPLY